MEGALEPDLTTKRVGQLCQVPLAVQWYLTDSGGGLIRKLPGETPLPVDLAPNATLMAGIDLSLLDTDPDEGQVVAVIDRPTVNAQAGVQPLSVGLQRLRQMAEQMGLGRAKSCPGPVGEVMKRPDDPYPAGGLRKNIRTVASQKKQVLDDPYVASLVAPERVDAHRFNVKVILGYRNNLGAEQIPVRFRRWARPGPDAAAPAGIWQELSLPDCAICTTIDDFFAERRWAPGRWWRRSSTPAIRMRATTGR